MTLLFPSYHCLSGDNLWLKDVPEMCSRQLELHYTVIPLACIIVSSR